MEKSTDVSTFGDVERIFPDARTCKGRLLAKLLRGDVTCRPLDGSTGPAGTSVYVQRLRRDGWPIVTEMRSSRNRYESVRYGVYRLSVEIGERERAFLAESDRLAGGAR